MMSISLSSRVMSVSELKSGEAISMRRMIDVGVLPECDVCKDGGSRPINERGGELCQREFERKSAIVPVAFVALDETADLGSPFGRQVSNGKIEGFGFHIRAGGLTFANHEVLQTAYV